MPVSLLKNVRTNGSLYKLLGKCMKCCREFNRVVQHIRESHSISKEQVLALFMYVRQLFEQERRYQSDYPHVNTFCHWMAHASLRRTLHMLRALVSISKVMSHALLTTEDRSARAATRAFTSAAGNLLDIPRLRSEFLSLAEVEHLEDYLFRNKPAWDAFIRWMLTDLTDKPICFPDDLSIDTDIMRKISKLHEEIMALPHPRNGDKIVKLVLTQAEDLKFHVCLVTQNNVTYDIELLGYESEAAFA